MKKIVQQRYMHLIRTLRAESKMKHADLSNTQRQSLETKLAPETRRRAKQRSETFAPSTHTYTTTMCLWQTSFCVSCGNPTTMPVKRSNCSQFSGTFPCRGISSSVRVLVVCTPCANQPPQEDEPQPFYTALGQPFYPEWVGEGREMVNVHPQNQQQ